MIFQSPFTGAFGLNIGDSSLKLVQLKKKWWSRTEPYFEVANMKELELPAGCVANGEIQKAEPVLEKILEITDKKNGGKALRSAWVVANLPVTKTFLKLIEIESTNDEIDADTVRAEAAKHLPFETTEVVLDWQIVETDEEKLPYEKNKTKVLIGAAPKSVVDSYASLLENTGFHPLALEIEDLSIARAMITAKKSYQGEARAILDLGGSRSSIIIYDKGSIQFSRLINICGNLLDTALVQKLKLERAEAAKLKEANGLTYDLNHPLYLKAAAELIDQLIDEIRETLVYYKDHFPSPNPVTHITMSGGLSAMRNLDKIISKKLGVRAYPGNAWKNLLNKKYSEERRFAGLRWASALGLGLRAADWLAQKM